MNDPTSRVLRLLSLLQTHKFWPGTELAERLTVSARTLRRDIDRLRELGYPVDATPGVAGGYRLAAGSHMPPLLLDDDEAVAIAVGLRAAAGASVSGIEDTALRAMAKLEQVLPDRLRRRVGAVHGNVVALRWGGAGPTVDAEALATLAQACRDHEEVRFDYRRRDGEEARRLVEPHQLVSAGRRWYLVAYDVRRRDWRTFRVDRLGGPRPAGGRFTPRPIPDGDAAAFVARSFAAMPAPYRATVLVAGPADAVRSTISWADAEVEPAGAGEAASAGAGEPVPAGDVGPSPAGERGPAAERVGGTSDPGAPGERTRVILRAEAIEPLVATVAVLAASFAVEVVGPPEVAERVSALGQHLIAASTGATTSTAAAAGAPVEGASAG